jgi:hypothetical protein
MEAETGDDDTTAQTCEECGCETDESHSVGGCSQCRSYYCAACYEEVTSRPDCDKGKC